MKPGNSDKNKKRIRFLIVKYMIVFNILFFLFHIFIYPESISDLENQLKQATDPGKSVLLNKLSVAVRNVRGDKKKYEKSLEYAQEALEYAKKYKQKDQEIYALANIARAYHNTNDNDRGLSYAKKSLELAEKRKNKKEILFTLNVLSDIYSGLPDHPKAVNILKRMIPLYAEIGDKENEAMTYNIIGNLLWQMGEMEEVIGYKMKALKLFRDLGDHHWVVMMMQYIGMFYSKFGNNKKALEYFLEAIRIGEKEGLIGPTSRVYFFIADFYKNQKKYKKASEYLDKTIKIAKDNKDTGLLIVALYQKGVLLREKKEYDQALVSLNRALKIQTQHESTLYDNPIDILINIGQVHYKKREYQKAISNYKKALDYALQFQAATDQAYCYKYIGEIQLAKRDFKNAYVNLNKSLKMSKKIRESLLIKDNYKLLSDLYEKQENYKKSLEYHRSYADLKDKIYDEESARSIAEMQTRYETEKKEKEIELLKKNEQVRELTLSRQRLIGIVSIAGFLLILLIMAYFVKKYYYLLSFWKKKHYIGSYKVMDKIASGGMGVIYKAHDIRDKTKTFAIKVLREEYFDSDTHKKRFKHEAAIIDQFNHPNIIKITERGESNGNLYIVMELINGKNLSELIKEEGKLSIGIVLNIMTQAIDALVKIHKKNIIHRDLKPENIMIVKTPGNPYFVKLLDFGLAKTKAFSQLTKTGMVLGTIFYLSPEQVMDSGISTASDIYSMGVICCEMLMGQKPFDGDTKAVIVGKILDNEPLQLSGFRSDIPGKLNRLLIKMISKNPQERPSAQAVLNTFYKLKEENAINS
jgi:tetratricopeptide (TPR) repeat protein